MQTRGQANIRPPQRYEGIIPHGDSDEEQYRPPTAPRRVSGYRGKVVEYDPNLPPAAFPTLELGQEREESTRALQDTTMRNLPPGQTHRNLPCEMHQPTHSTLNRFSSVSLHQSRFGDSAISRPAIDITSHRSRNTHESTTSMRYPSLPRGAATAQTGSPLERPSLQGEQWWDTSNNMRNPVYANNMRTMQRLSARTEDDWNIAEMETSDEEETSARTATSTSARAHRSPQEMAQLWEELPLALKLDLLDIMEDVCPTRAEAMQGLRLNGAQSQELLHHLEERNRQTASEDEAIQTLQTETHRVLLSRSGEQLKNVTQTGYRNMLEKGLYRTRRADYYTATSGEVAKAKDYLSYCEQNPELLDHWNNVMGSSVDGANDGNEQDSVFQRIPNGEESVPKVVTSIRQVPPEAAFPTKTCIPVRHTPKSAAPNTVQPTANPSEDAQLAVTPSRLSITTTDPNSVVHPLDLHKPSSMPRASEIQTPNITPDSLVPQQISDRPERMFVSDHPKNVPAPENPAVKEDSESNEEPPLKKRETAISKRKSAPANSILSNNTASASKASTKSRKRVTFTPSSRAAQSDSKDVSTLNTLPSNQPRRSTAPKATMGAPASKSFLAEAPKVAPNDTTAPHAPPTSTEPTPSANGTVSSTQAKAPRRRKATAAAEPKAPEPAQESKLAGLSTRKKTGPATRKTGGGKAEGKFDPNAGVGGDGSDVINGRS